MNVHYTCSFCLRKDKITEKNVQEWEEITVNHSQFDDMPINCFICPTCLIEVYKLNKENDNAN